ncbi:hypothetical protein BpHYR1_004758 [Brachionus plicatilis]|uniref:Transmembrane protein n=1 Tax=Brachionus plicatilis TaxID=10195 RepID=A0A3M7RRE5_BRAPC|nr:hypothetical protein BpHYR1_004758 [Brachionus plicatilis]
MFTFSQLLMTMILIHFFYAQLIVNDDNFDTQNTFTQCSKMNGAEFIQHLMLSQIYFFFSFKLLFKSAISFQSNQLNHLSLLKFNKKGHLKILNVKINLIPDVNKMK